MSADILIKIDNLKKTFQGGLEALKGVNLETVSYTHLTLPTIYSV